MSVIFRNLQAPLFIKIEKNILSKIRNILQDQYLQFERPLIVSDNDILELGGNEILQGFSEEAVYLCEDNSITEAKKIITEAKEKNNDLIIAVGGGKILDVGKYAATKAQMNYISVPTTPSNDGLASPIAVLKNDEGVSESLGVNMPMGILVDLEIIKKAPLQNIQAGTGDLISNFSALADWKLAHQDLSEKIDDFAASLAYSAADLIYGNFGKELKIDLTSEKFLKTLVNGLVLSGIAMNIAGSSRPCSGAEHEISHALDKLYPGTAMHGQQVALGTLIAEKLRDNDYANYKKFFTAVGLPTSYKDLGFTEEQMIKAIEFAPKTRADRYTILEKLNLDTEKIKETINSL